MEQNNDRVYTLKEAATLLATTHTALAKYLWKHRHRFKPPQYMRGDKHPRRHRVISQPELEVLRSMRVK